MNNARIKLDSPYCHLGVGPVDCHHSDHSIAHGAFDYRRIPLEYLDRGLLNEFEYADKNLNPKFDT